VSSPIASNPRRSICCGALDVAIPPQQRGLNSRALIDACKPYERRGEFPPVAESSEELKNKVREKWREVIFD